MDNNFALLYLHAGWSVLEFNEGCDLEPIYSFLVPDAFCLLSGPLGFYFFSNVSSTQTTIGDRAKVVPVHVYFKRAKSATYVH